MKKIYLSILLLSFSLLSFSQIKKPDSLSLGGTSLSLVSDEYKKFIPNFSPLSPNAASFQKYGDYQVNLSTGVPDISIPLYVVQEGSLSVPITLRCHASGHTMNDFASWVGWGMNLDVGASLNRSIMGGMADDNVSTGNYLTNPIIARDLCGSDVDYAFLSSVHTGNADIEPDLFSYSLSGTSGKFMLGQNGGIPFLMPWQAVNISSQTANNGVIQTFKIKDMDGHIYDFGANADGTGANEMQRVYPDGSSSGVVDVGIVSWNVSRMSAGNTNDVIKFQYQSGGTIQQTFQSWSASINYDASNNPTTQSVAPQPIRQVKEVDSQHIYKIITSNGEIEFEQSTVAETRLDQPESRYLKQIKVYAYEGLVKNLLKRIVFNYSYFKDRTNANGRLKLDSLQIYGASGTESQVYKFDYMTNSYSWKYSTGNVVADADWSKQDYFGYFNNKNNNHLIDIATYNGGLTPVTILNGKADRTTNETYLKEGVLSKITYPTGGYTSFDFEANRYKNNSVEVLGGGLRIKAIRSYASTGILANMKRYEYASDGGTGIGKLNAIWSFPASTSVGEMKYLNGLDINKMVYLGTNGASEMSSHDGTPVYYTNVKEYLEESSSTTTNGYQEYSFSYEPDVIVNTPYSLIRDIEPWKRGLLVKKDVRASDNSLLSRTIHQYSPYKEQSISNVGKVRMMNQATATCSTCSSGMRYGFLVGGGITSLGTPCSDPELIYLSGVNKTGRQEITQKIERVYKGTDSLEVITNYTYDASNYVQLTQSSILTSKAQTLMTQYKYPYHYGYEPYLSMKAKNVLNPIIEETTYLDNVQSKWRFTDYATTGSYQNPLKVRIKIGSGVEQTLINFNTYDATGHLNQYQERNGVITNIAYYITTDIGKINLVKSVSVGGGSTGTVLQRSINYDYFPLIGLKTQTDLNGYAVSFNYDNFQRLQNVKDSQSYLLKDFNYHYANQTALAGLGLTPTNTLNYIISRVAREAQTGTALSSTVENTTTEISYLDGLGRGLQSLIWKGSPDQTKDIITQTSLFDGFGRANKSILTTPSDGIFGAYKSTALSLANTFYGDTAAYAQTVFEPSPLNRPLKEFGAGQAWKIANKSTSFEYLLAGDGIIRFDVTTDSTVTCKYSYPASSLLNHCVSSEREIKTYELKDKQGRVTHKFQQMEVGFAVTAYVYDDANGGRLAYVIPPETYKKLGAGLITDFKKSQDIFKEGIFSYAYDGIGNVIEKHIPGGGTTRYVLDKHDRVVLENDDKDSTNLWKMTKYDALGRPILKGIITNIGAASRQTVQTNFDNFGNVNTNYAYEDRGTDLLGYTNRSFPTAYPVADANIKHVIYYDDYTTWQADVNYNFNVSNAFHAQGFAKGLITGQLKRNLKTGAWQKFVYYYDYRGKLIQEFYLSNRGNLIRKDYQYRFNGELLKVRIEKKSGANVISTKILTYQYDHLGRKIKYNHFLNGTDKSIATYGYDDIGRLNKKSFSPISVINSLQTGSWNATTTWVGSSIPTISDNVTINTGHTVTINTGEAGSAGSLFDKGKLTNNGSFYLGSLKPATTATELHSLNYQYHIRGGLRGINLDVNNNLRNTLFSFKLTYEDDATYYDNNIRNQYWKSSIDGIQRAYQYTYDKASRLIGAAYGSGKAGEDYALNSVSYDDNGNIKTLSRNGATNSNYTAFGNVDNLTYTYQTNSNKLQKIADAITSNADLGDFRDASNTDNDYTYWQDGSLKKDKNKKIASITYNYLKLPEVITFENARTITTEYNAGGTKLKKIDSNGETTDYEEDEIYVNGNLYQTSHDEGRIANGIYEYNITDHNNDLRVSFRDSLGIAVPTQSIFYDPWGLSMKGMAITRNPTNFNKYQFLNRETQFETGYIDLIHRQFDPQIGRFTSQDPVIDGQEHLSLYQYGWNNPILKPDPNGLMPCCGGVGDFIMGFTHAFNEDVSPIPTNLVNAEGGRNYSNGADLGHKAAMLVGAIEVGLGGGVVGGAAVATVTTAGVAAPVAVEVAVGGAAAIAHGVSTIKNAERNLNSHGNKLDDKPAEGYTLRDKKTKEVKKYGETTRGEDKFGEGNQKRYSKKELESKNVEYQKEKSGTKKEMHKWQNEKIKNHKTDNEGNRPALNKSDY